MARWWIYPPDAPQRLLDTARPAGYRELGESLEVGLFEWDSIPWDQIAFPSVRWALNAWYDNTLGVLGAPAGNPSDDWRWVHRIDSVTAA